MVINYYYYRLLLRVTKIDVFCHALSSGVYLQVPVQCAINIQSLRGINSILFFKKLITFHNLFGMKSSFLLLFYMVTFDL